MRLELNEEILFVAAAAAKKFHWVLNQDGAQGRLRQV
jgi:hypothetical protein